MDWCPQKRPTGQRGVGRVPTRTDQIFPLDSREDAETGGDLFSVGLAFGVIITIDRNLSSERSRNERTTKLFLVNYGTGTDPTRISLCLLF